MSEAERAHFGLRFRFLKDKFILGGSIRVDCESGLGHFSSADAPRAGANRPQEDRALRLENQLTDPEKKL